ncbi:MAG: class I SAM-dependent methyltransferase [Ruminococcus sp.]|nr:class I SAM-dependent methyltransferase [Ruminococcus sp.]
MDISLKSIDAGRAFDWGRTSADYARYRDIYPPDFYKWLAENGIGTAGQRVLDLGTGTGVLPRNMYRYGVQWTGIDISENQIAWARELAGRESMDISFLCTPAEELDLPGDSFDAVTACQCFWYFDMKTLVPKLTELLKPHGKLAVMQMEWLPFEDKIAGECEQLVLKYNPTWSGAGETRKPVHIPDELLERFSVIKRAGFDLHVLFTRESWHGRLRACRGTAASLSESELAEWEKENAALLEGIAPESFTILHYAAFCILELK